MRKPGSHGFDCRLFSGEPHGKKPHGIVSPSVQLELLFHENTAREMIAETLVDPVYAAQLDDVRTNAENHEAPSPRASRINRRISRTAVPRPSNTARAMIAWPIFSSTISGMRAIAFTFW